MREICDLLGVDPPNPATDDPAANAYVFERAAAFQHPDGTSWLGRIDHYRRDWFVQESKKVKAGPATEGFDDALPRARTQAENYARALPAAEGRPPFVVVVDVGNVTTSSGWCTSCRMRCPTAATTHPPVSRAA